MRLLENSNSSKSNTLMLKNIIMFAISNKLTIFVQNYEHYEQEKGTTYAIFSQGSKRTWG